MQAMVLIRSNMLQCNQFDTRTSILRSNMVKYWQKSCFWCNKIHNHIDYDRMKVDLATKMPVSALGLLQLRPANELITRNVYNKVLLVQGATPDTIIQFHDQLSNELPTTKGTWNFNFKIYRNNPYSIPKDAGEEVTTSPESKYLYTLSPSYLPDSTITLIDKKSVGVFPCVVKEELGETETDTYIPDEHLRDGATTGLNDPLDTFLTSKLQSLWSLRQTIKGDGGQIYELENSNLVIRTSNISLHGNFRGLLIQIDLSNKLVDEKDPKGFKEVFEKICSRYNVPQGSLKCNVLNESYLDKYGDLCLQYAEILNF